MADRIRLSPQTVLVLDALLEATKTWRYGYDLSRDTGLKSGTLYPILMRLADHALVETRWETTESGTPPRHMYRLTAAGVQSARLQVREYKSNRGRRAPLREAKT
ncbi:MAG: PadR family transcriptional regulator [Gemmatimonadaceae bacterium]